MSHFFFDFLMGALISKSKRKRSENCITPDSKSPSLDPQIRSSKRIRTASSMNRTLDQSVPSKSTASRIYRYPEPSNRIPREVHAPCRPSRFGFAACLKTNPSSVDSDAMGNAMGIAILNHYEDAKKKAISSFQYFKEEKEKQVIGDKEDGSSVEVIEIVDNDSAEMDGAVNFRDSASSMDSVLTSTKVESTGRMLNSLTMNQQPLHKQLYEDSVRKRSNKLSGLNFKIDLLEKKRNMFGLYRQVKKPERVVVKEPFVPLTKEEEVNIKRAFSNSNRRKVLVTHEDSSLQITGEMLQCLRPGAWLNDEVINLYLELLKEREKREPKTFLKCHFFNTFFYKKLNGRSGYDYKSVRRWTTQRKLGYSLFDCDKIFVPIHKDVHWCLAVISKKDEKFQYLDSLRGRDREVMKVLAKYIVDEVKDKNGQDIDVCSWKHEYVEDLPDQENGFDCGMFMIKYIDFYSRNVGLCFNQEHMPYFRLRTAKEILKLRAE